jgi:hypothetical protein
MSDVYLQKNNRLVNAEKIAEIQGKGGESRSTVSLMMLNPV